MKNNINDYSEFIRKNILKTYDHMCSKWPPEELTDDVRDMILNMAVFDFFAKSLSDLSAYKLQLLREEKYLLF